MRVLNQQESRQVSGGTHDNNIFHVLTDHYPEATAVVAVILLAGVGLAAYLARRARIATSKTLPANSFIMPDTGV